MKPESKQMFEKLKQDARDQIEALQTWLRTREAGPDRKMHDTTEKTIQFLRDQIAMYEAIEKAEEK